MTDGPPTTRRRLLLTAGTAAVAGVAGCAGGRGRSTPVTVLAAGSLQNALANGLEPAVDIPVEVEAHGSATVARLVDEGQRDPDIVSVADAALFEEPLSPPWHAVFTSNAVVVAYDPATDGGERLAEAGPDRWYEPMLDGAVTVGRTDPDQDPLGYRTRFALELAARYYDVPDLRDRILRRDQVYPETSLISQFETGSVDAAFAYRNMAVERGYEYVELPDQVDLSDPRHAEEWYATTSYTLPTGQEVRGAPIGYASTVRHASDAARSVFAAHTTGGYLEDHGFLLRDQFPAYAGDVPRRIRRATDRLRAEPSSAAPDATDPV
jgi:molybdate/tungstate transport system substrate-binding protein